MLKHIVKSEITVVFGNLDIALMQTEDDNGDRFVVVTTGDAVQYLADYSKVGDHIDLKPENPKPVLSTRIGHLFREYRWDWNLTPDDVTLIVASIEIPIEVKIPVTI